MSRKTDLAWAAGIVDGEGCIRLNYHRDRDVYTLAVCVTNTNLAMMEKLHAVIGVGSLKFRKSKQPLHHKPIWLWTAAAKNGERALKMLLPYLVAKREQALLGLESRKYVQKDKSKHPNVVVLEEYKKKISVLNQRGPTVGEYLKKEA